MTRTEEQLTNLLKGLRDISLPNKTRARMRAELIAYAELHAAPAARPHAHTSLREFRFRLYAGLSAAVLLIAALGGTAYASENALPGDALYPVKVGFTEPIQTALVPSDRGKAAWHAILAERRLDEAAQLAATGTLSTTTQTELAANFNTQVSASEESANRLKNNGDTAGSLSAQTDLEARLAAHEQILSVIAAHYATATSTDGESTHAALEQMLALVTDHEHAVASLRIALEDAMAPGSAKDDNAPDTTATTTEVAIAMPMHTHLHMGGRETPVAQVQTAAAVRTAEEVNILQRHAAFLARFMPAVASTTASSTATTTVSTTVEATSTATSTDPAGSSAASGGSQ